MKTSRKLGILAAFLLAALLVTGPPLRAGEPANARWWAAVQKDLAEREYEASWQAETALEDLPAAWHAPNRAHGFRAYFVERGIRVVPRASGGPAWEWSLALIGYGRGGTVWPVPGSTPSPSGNRVEYARGSLTEWYVNDPRGLEQGFALPAPPEEFARWSGAEPIPGEMVAPGRGREVRAEDLIHLDLALEGTLSAKAVEGGQVVDFVTPEGARAVRYADLVVTDAGGRRLDAWMEGFVTSGARGVRLVIDAREAVWPLEVDPLATSPSWTAESDLAGAEFGCSVATAGDVNGDGYDDVIVGAQYYWNAVATPGRAYLYLGSASGLAASPAWTAESDQDGSNFGASVSGAGDVNGDGYADVIVGAPYFENGQADEGRAYVYLGSASGLAISPSWTAESNQAGALFGYSVSGAGDVNGDGYADVIVGAMNYSNGQANEGRAFLYFGSASGPATSPAWTAESDQMNAMLGSWVSAAGDVNGDGYADVIVGANYYDNGQTDEGRAYVYLGSASGLAASPAWTAESDQASSYFGTSVYAAGDVNGDGYADVIVGAYWYDNGESNEGRAYVYLGSASGLAASPAWTAESDQFSSYFGISVSTAGDVNGDGYADVIVGANYYDNGQSDEGRAYVYLGSASGPASQAGWTAESDQYMPYFGCSVATAGDVNGDGYADVIVGAYFYDNGEGNEGRAYVYLGSPAGLGTSPAWTAESDQGSAWFGYSVSTAGDVNGDGYADVIVGAHLYDNGETDEGRAYVYLGSASGLAASPAWTAESDQASALFGYSVATAGDVNGDGYSDVIVGATGYDNGQTDEGGAFVYLGSSSGLAASPAWTGESNQLGADFGFPVSTAGDVNGDGYADVIVGAISYSNGQSSEGGAFVYLGSASALGPSPAWTAEGDQEGLLFARSVSTAGDVNGDGYADVIVGANYYSNGLSYEGGAFVYLGSPAGLATSPAWTAESDQQSAHFGWAVSTAGDVNGDGYSDVVVGALYYDNGQNNEGRAYVYLGSSSGLAASPAWTAESDQANANLGWSVSTAGDVNGDGYADVIVGAPMYDNGETDEGRAFLYYGNGGAGLSLRPQQRRSDDAAPISPGLRSRTPGSFRLAALGRSPFGRGRMKLEWEAKPLRRPFDGSGLQRSPAWMDSGAASAALSDLVSSLEPGAYHWRVRLLYKPSSSPLAHSSRWLAVPWNGWNETDVVLGTFIGGTVWEDRDGDGIRGTNEPAMARLRVYLLDPNGAVLRSTFTDNSGGYRFEVGSDSTYRVRYTIPSGYLLTLQDQGPDDTLDSDADPDTGQTVLIGPPYQAFDASGWSAGFVAEGPCFAPDEPIYISGVRVGLNDYTILDFQDGNQAQQVTGYNVYRSSNAGLPHASWPLLASDVVDMDAGTANIQWVDTTGDVPPGGIWYYNVTAYNSACDAEGPW